VKIGSAQASSTEKRSFGFAEWLATPCRWGKITQRQKQLIDNMNNKPNGKSR
jgi:hypothetical protein